MSIGGSGMFSETCIWNYILSKTDIAGFFLAGESRFYKAIVKT